MVYYVVYYIMMLEIKRRTKRKSYSCILRMISFEFHLHWTFWILLLVNKFLICVCFLKAGNCWLVKITKTTCFKINYFSPTIFLCTIKNNNSKQLTSNKYKNKAYYLIFSDEVIKTNIWRDLLIKKKYIYGEKYIIP